MHAWGLSQWTVRAFNEMKLYEKQIHKAFRILTSKNTSLHGKKMARRELTFQEDCSVVEEWEKR